MNKSTQKKSDLRTFLKKNVKHGAIYGFGDILKKAVSFLLLPIYTRYLTPADYGILELLNVTTSILGLFVIHGMYSAFSRSYLYDYKGDYEQQRELLSTTYFYLLSSGIIFFGLLTWSKDFINTLLFDDEDYTVILTIAFGICCFESIRGFAFSIFRNNFQSVKFVILRMIGFMINVSLNIYLVVFKKLGVLGVVFGNLITSILISLIGTFLIRKYFTFKFSFAKLKPMLKFGLPFVPTGIAWFVFDISDRYFLTHLSSQTELGLYALGAKFGMIVQFLLILPLQRVYFASYYPLSKEDPENARYILGRFFTYFCAAGGFVGLGIIMFSEPMIKIMSAESFWAAYYVVPFLVLSNVLLGLIHTLNAGINITGKTKYLPFIVSTVAMVNVGLNIILIPKYGMIGAGCATFFSYVAYFLISFVVNQRIYPMEIETGRLFRILFAAITILSIGYFFRSDSIIIQIAYCILVVLLYPILLYLSGFFLSSEKEKMRKYIEKKALFFP